MPIILLMPHASCAYWFLAAAATNYQLKTQIYYFTVPEVRSPNRIGRAVFLPEVLGRICFPAVSRFYRLPVFFGPWPLPPSPKPGV